jgi:hypothetical protein
MGRDFVGAESKNERQQRRARAKNQSLDHASDEEMPDENNPQPLVGEAHQHRSRRLPVFIRGEANSDI